MCLIALLLAAVPVTAVAVQDAADLLSGVWTGGIATPAGPLETSFYIEPDGQGGWTGSADTPEQRVWGLPLVAVELHDEDGSETRVAFVMGHARYEGLLNREQRTLDGHWIQNGAEAEFDLDWRALPPPLAPELAARLAGLWEGVLELGAIELRMVLRLARDERGRLGGYMKSPDQTPLEFAITRIDVLGAGRLRVAVGTLGATLEAELAQEDSELRTTFLQGAARLPLNLTRVEAETVVQRPQTPRPPFPYRVEEVGYRNEPADVTLAGTLTLPQGEGPFPAVLLISGSGAQDRDETVFQHKPFWVIADHLTRRGVAVLRVDDRGVGGSSAGPSPGTATTADFARDAAAGVDFLRARAEVDAKRIGLVGHSEGGVIAPLVARDHGGVAFLVLLAGTGVRGDRLLTMQVEALARAEGMQGEELEQLLAMEREVFALLLDEALDEDVRRERLRTLIENAPTLASTEDAEGEIALAMNMLETPWVRWFAAHDPAPVLEELRIPILALNGSLDLQVPAGPNLEAISAALKRAGNEQFVVREFEGLNHLFQHSATGLVAEYGRIEETFAVEVLEVMGEWIALR